jgi:release factor glutamine methyltransferase
MISKGRSAASRTVRDALAAAHRRLGGTPAALVDANVLLRHVSGKDGAWLVAHVEDALDAPVLERYERALERRARGEPVAYITGECWFYGRRFEVSPAVLVPRPETEQVLEAALAFVDGHPERVRRLCDAGTGSGILAISLACERPALTLSAIDRSPEALSVARRNAGAHGVDSRIEFREGDLFAGTSEAARFDCIVANLPYVRTGDLALAPDPTSFEPRLALDGGRDGLEVYRRFLEQASPRLAPDGAMFLETGPDTAAELAALVARNFPGRTCSVLRDFAGLDRIVALAG